MKRVLRTTLMALIVVTLLASMMAPAAFAAGDPVGASVPVKITMHAMPAEGDLPALDEVSVTVQPLTEGAPAVNPASGVVKCEGAVGYGTMDITFGPSDRLGVYEYGVTIGNSSLTDVVINDTQEHYVVLLYVLNNSDFTGYETQTVIYEAQLVDGVYTYDSESQSKPEALTASKTYAAPMKITVSKRWPDGGERPITVILYEVVTREKNGKTTKEQVELERIDLSPSCNWQHTFAKLDSRKTYVLDELGYPGYHESYRYDTDNPLHWFVTITNYKSLYQTGQLNWPIPVLMCLGSMFMLAGVYMMRKKEEQTNE